MANKPIDYTLSDADRRGLASSFGVNLSEVPTRVTGGEVTEELTGVMFSEGIRGYRIALRFEGRPTLSAAAGPALVGRKQHAA